MTKDLELAHAVGEWLDEHIDSHEIYETTVFASLPAGIVYDNETDRLVTREGSAKLGSRTFRQMQERESAAVTGNPKGAYIDEGADMDARGFGGFELSATLDMLLTGKNAGGQFFGRGSAHRACIKHLREA